MTFVFDDYFNSSTAFVSPHRIADDLSVELGLQASGWYNALIVYARRCSVSPALIKRLCADTYQRNATSFQPVITASQFLSART